MTIEELVAEIDKLSVLELNDLVKAIEEKYGVSAAAGVVVAAAGAGAADGAAAEKDEYAFAVLGGQNPLAMFCAGAEKIDLSNLSAYDQGCNESFQNSMKDYFLGNATYEEALDNFYKSVIEKYPELSK